MNKFNKRMASAVKSKKLRVRVKRKRLGLKEKHKERAQLVSGQRTGKAARRRERLERLEVSFFTSLIKSEQENRVCAYLAGLKDPRPQARLVSWSKDASKGRHVFRLCPVAIA